MTPAARRSREEQDIREEQGIQYPSFPRAFSERFSWGVTTRWHHADAMTSSRRRSVDPEAAGFYRCVSRCARRALLSGTDRYTGQYNVHRKAWVEVRVPALAESFAVEVYARAVMSNSLHLMVHLYSGVAWTWSAQDLARRWSRLCPVRAGGTSPSARYESADARASRSATAPRMPPRRSSTLLAGSRAHPLRCNVPRARNCAVEPRCRPASPAP